MSTIADTKDLMRRFESAMNTRRLDLLDEIISPDVVRRCEATPAFEVTNLDQLKDFLRADASVFPDNKQTFEHILVDGDMVAIWATYEGTQRGWMGPFPPSDKYAKFSFSGVFRMENGKIAEWWVTWDNMSILGQLGHLPG
ncbi:ester cyclase [Pseudonocardia bannensis]|uniref:Ester cyclase n=1 Tax=Pseudonocardia bannensis TaxID=630973 RepID=A0A848DDI6_9PSEU|nr:ester cyclase [Pseudonocardia bannensis]NMH90656.1 ester cyclase [Pseudonocardia bannensis]